METNQTFSKRSFAVQSFICALLLAFAMFAILPLSLTLNQPKKEIEQIKISTLSPKLPQLQKTENQSIREIKTPNFQDSISTKYHSEKLKDRDLDFSKIAISQASLSAKANVDFADFSVAPTNFEQVIFEISELDNIPRRLNNISIKYPQKMLQRQIEGNVLLNVIIAQDGSLTVESVAKSDSEDFSKAAIEAVEALKYEPPKKNGKVVSAKFLLPIPFKLR